MDSTQSIQKSLKENSIVCWIVAFLFYLSLYPYFVWSIEPYASWWLSTPLLLMLFSQTNKSQNLVFLILFIFISIWAGFFGGGNLIGITMTALISIIFAVDESFLIRVYRRYRLIFVVSLTFSLVVFILVTLGVSLPHHSVPSPPRNTIDYDYYIYPFYACPSVDDWRDLGINRFTALFDEPGVVGTISFILLFIEKFNIKKFGNCVLLVSGVLSFSLFFYIACFIYIAYYLFFGHAKQFYKLLIGILILPCLIMFARTELFEGYIGERLSWNANERTISGDNRSSDDLKEHIKQIKGTTAYFFGEPELVSNYQDSASLEKQILARGFITVFLFFAFFVLFSYSYLKFSKEWFLFLAVFFAVMYNRPTMFDCARLFLYYIMIIVWSPCFQNILDEQGVIVDSKSWFIRNF